jgi:hypothetical protein
LHPEAVALKVARREARRRARVKIIEEFGTHLGESGRVPGTACPGEGREALTARQTPAAGNYLAPALAAPAPTSLDPAPPLRFVAGSVREETLARSALGRDEADG